MAKIFLIRHGTTDSNMNGVFQGVSDFPLNRLGLAQAEALGDRFKGEDIRAVYASNLQRAYRTAEGAIRQLTGLTINQDPELREINGGRLEGRELAVNLAEYPDVMERFRTQPGSLQCPGGDSGKDVYLRMSQAVDKIALQYGPEEQIMIVSHGFAIQALMAFIKGYPAEEMPAYICHNTAVALLDYECCEGRVVNRQLIYEDNIDHLTEDLVFGLQFRR